jgi:hypothetical protein
MKVDVKIKLMVKDGVELDLTIQEAKELSEILKGIMDTKTIIEKEYVPYRDYPYYPYYPYQPWTVTCSTTPWNTGGDAGSGYYYLSTTGSNTQ